MLKQQWPNGIFAERKNRVKTLEYKWIALSNTTIGTLMASLDRNIVVIALPTIATMLHTSLLTLVWIVSRVLGCDCFRTVKFW